MSTLVFDQQASIHFQEIRSLLVRIPEVIQRIRAVQEEMDAKGVSLDLSNFIASDNETFLHNYRRKEFAGVIIQLGIYDRYLRFFEAPDKMVGVVNSPSAAQILNGTLKVSDLIEQTFFGNRNSKNPDQLPGLPILSGIQIPKFSVIEKPDQEDSTSDEAIAYTVTADLKLLLNQLREEGEDLIFDVGVGAGGLKGTLDLDPSLSWMWEQMNSAYDQAAAN